MNPLQDNQLTVKIDNDKISIWILSFITNNRNLVILTAVLILLYLVYYIKCRRVYLYQGPIYGSKTKNIGRPLPPFANGWYIVCRSEEVKAGEVRNIQIAGENLVLFRSKGNQKGKSQVFALDAYCKHMGANIGIGGKVINGNCIQCPFHGWMYQGTTGVCVDYDGKPVRGKSIQYNSDKFCKQGGRDNLQWNQESSQKVELRKYPICQQNGYIHVWLHCLPEHQLKPQYHLLNMESIVSRMQYRGKFIHDVPAHMQDIPENGCDSEHFKFVHLELAKDFKLVRFLWQPKWVLGTDPNLQSMFSHPNKRINRISHDFYKQCIQPYPDKQFITVTKIQNHMKMPFFSQMRLVSVLVIQVGPAVVYTFLMFPTHIAVVNHYLQPQKAYMTRVIHEVLTPGWLPYWMSALPFYIEFLQVNSDMKVWECKQFSRKMFYKEKQMADECIRQWREWYSQHYQGRSDQQQQRKLTNKDQKLLSW